MHGIAHVNRRPQRPLYPAIVELSASRRMLGAPHAVGGHRGGCTVGLRPLVMRGGGRLLDNLLHRGQRVIDVYGLGYGSQLGRA